MTPEPEEYTTFCVGAAPLDGSADETSAKILTDDKKEPKSKSVRTRTLLKRGSPSTEILKASKGFDLVVIGSRGFGRLRRLMLGSVSNSVVQQSKVPVLIVRPAGSN